MIYHQIQNSIPAKTNRAARHMIAFCSGSKGIGKTWLASTICHSLALQKIKVLFFDADCGLENISCQLDISSSTPYSRLLNGSITLNNAVKNFNGGGFDIINSFSGENGLALAPVGRVQLLGEDLAHLANYYDAVFLDCSDEDFKTVNIFFNLCRTIVIIVNTDTQSLTQAYQKIVQLKNICPDAQFKIVINHAQSFEEGRQVFKSLLQAAEKYIKLNLGLLGIIRQDPHIREAVLNRSLLLKRYPSCRGAEDAVTVARSILKEYLNDR